MDANFHTVVYVCVCVYVDLYKGSYYCRLSNLLDINAPNICLLPIKKETQARQGARKVLVLHNWSAPPTLALAALLLPYRWRDPGMAEKLPLSDMK